MRHFLTDEAQTSAIQSKFDDRQEFLDFMAKVAMPYR
jgi:hypothetical protein